MIAPQRFSFRYFLGKFIDVLPRQKITGSNKHATSRSIRLRWQGASRETRSSRPRRRATSRPSGPLSWVPGTPGVVALQRISFYFRRRSSLGVPPREKIAGFKRPWAPGAVPPRRFPLFYSVVGKFLDILPRGKIGDVKIHSLTLASSKLLTRFPRAPSAVAP